MTEALQRNSIDVIKPVGEAIRDGLLPRMQMFGGVGSAALTHEQTVIKPDEKRIIAPEGLWLPTEREDGTLRDLDVLILSTDTATIEQAEQTITELIEEDNGKRDKQGKVILATPLEVSVFGLHTIAELRDQKGHPLRSLAKVWVSDRYVDERALQREDIDPVREIGFKAVFPFAAPISKATLETWTLEVNGLEYPVPHPGATVVNYLTRSNAGLRPKDADKVVKLSDCIERQFPEVVDWIVDGPGKSQLDLARLLLAAGKPDIPTIDLANNKIHVQATRPELLYIHPQNIFVGDSEYDGQYVNTAIKKARVVGAAEKLDPVVTFWLKNVEPRIKRIVQNR